MRVSIIIPSYGQKQYLAEAIDSALAQTIHSEIIVIDDGSTDGSLAIAKEYEPFGVKVISQVNKGLASARNTGIMNATGEYILPLDADDFLKENAVERLLEVAEFTKADVIAPSIHCFGLAEQTVILKEDPTIADFRDGNRLAYCALIKRSVLLETGGYSPRMDVLGGYEDLALWLDLLTRGKVIVSVPEPLLFYRVKENSMWKEASKPEKHRKLMEQIIHDYPLVFPSKELQEAVKVKYPR